MMDREVLRAERISGRKRIFGEWSELAHVCCHSTRCGINGKDCRHKEEHKVGLHCISHVCYNYGNGKHVYCVPVKEFKSDKEDRLESIWED